jgi:hypothetical protein
MQPINRFCRPPAHATKWTVVVDRPREARTLTLFNTQADAHAEIIRFRERGVAHAFALAPVAATASRAARTLEANRKLDLGRPHPLGLNSVGGGRREGQSRRPSEALRRFGAPQAGIGV